ncbi:fructose-bisphosphate aldolase [Streptococcus pneumoniae]|nr:fructose-bisphosphate aldolase [Streptococcus pneumoniae]
MKYFVPNEVFSIRKLKVGTCSVLLAISILGSQGILSDEVVTSSSPMATKESSNAITNDLDNSSVEAEVGTIGGEEDGIIGKGELAPIEDAKAMVETGIDFLAAGIGNIHGPYPVNWEGLDLDHLQKLTEALPGFPIVLHGGSGIPDEQIQAAIKLGVAKVNVNTECQIAFANATRKFARDYEANEAEYDKKKLFDPRKFLADGVKAIQASVEERIDVFGSEGKA